MKKQIDATYKYEDSQVLASDVISWDCDYKSEEKGFWKERKLTDCTTEDII